VQIIRYLILILFLAATGHLRATEFRSVQSYTLLAQEKLEDDLIIAGKNVKIDGEIGGDLLCGCRSLVIKGKIANSVFNFSQYCDASGEVKGSLTTFCQNLSLSGKVGRNLTAFSADLFINREAVIEGQLTAFVGELDLEGEVKRGVVAKCEEVIISGKITGDVKIEADKLNILEGAVIDGNLEYKSPRQAKIDPKAKIFGEVKWTEKEKKDKKKGFYREIGFFNSALFAGNLATGLVLIALFRKRWERSKNAIGQSFLKSLGLGFVLAVCVPIAAVLLLITVIGIPLSLLTIVAYGILFYLAKLVFSTTVGGWIFGIFRKDARISLFWAFLAGYLVFWLLTGFPVLGTILYILAFLVGFGGIILGNRENGVPPAPVGQGTTTSGS